MLCPCDGHFVPRTVLDNWIQYHRTPPYLHPIPSVVATSLPPGTTLLLLSHSITSLPEIEGLGEDTTEQLLFNLVARAGTEAERVADSQRAAESRLGWRFARGGEGKGKERNLAVELVRNLLFGEDHRRFARELAMQFPVGARRTWLRSDLSAVVVKG